MSLHQPAFSPGLGSPFVVFLDPAAYLTRCVLCWSRMLGNCSCLHYWLMPFYLSTLFRGARGGAWRGVMCSGVPVPCAALTTYPRSKSQANVYPPLGLFPAPVPTRYPPEERKRNNSLRRKKIPKSIIIQFAMINQHPHPAQSQSCLWFGSASYQSH